jgi:hypothetical protein
MKFARKGWVIQKGKKFWKDAWSEAWGSFRQAEIFFSKADLRLDSDERAVRVVETRETVE